MRRRLHRRSYRQAGRLVPTPTGGLRASTVVLTPGAVMDWHSTKTREELLLAHRGRLCLEVRVATRRTLRRLRLTAGQCAFLPARTWHRVVNRSSSLAAYTYVTASAKHRRVMKKVATWPRGHTATLIIR